MESKSSVQDEFLALATIANEARIKVQIRCTEAPEKWGEFLQEVWALVIILSELYKHTSEHVLTATQRIAVQEAQDDCQHVLADTERALKNRSFSLSNPESDDEFSGFYKRKSGKRNRKIPKREINENEIGELRERFCLIYSALDAAITEPNRGLLNWLVPNECNTGIQAENISKRAIGSYQWFIDSADYQAWSSAKGKTLFCHGGLGVGKSILASTVIASLQETFIAANDTAVCYFYLSRRGSEEESIDRVLLAMLWQLVHHMPTIPKSVMDVFKRHETTGGRPSPDEAREAFCTVASAFSKLFIVIDALNEHRSLDTCPEDIMSCLSSLQAETGANLFLTSREIPRPTETFLHNSWTIFRASDQDIAQFVQQNMHQLPSSVQSDSWYQDEIVTEIVRAADGVFVHAQLRLDTLTKMKIKKKGKFVGKQIRSTLSCSLDALDAMYEKTWQQICEQSQSQIDLAIKTLSWVTYAKRPLTNTELQHALSIQINELEPPRDNIPTIEDIVASCCGFLTLDLKSNLVRPIHCTAAEYFTTLVSRGEMSIPSPATMLTDACITYLSFNVFRVGQCISDVDFQERLASYPFYNYASSNWGHHAIFADNTDLVRLFLDDCSLVEASCQALFSVKQNEDDNGYSQRTPKCPWSIYLSEAFGLVESSKNSEGSSRKEVFGEARSWNWGDSWQDDFFGIGSSTSELAKRNRETIVQLLLENGAKTHCQENNPDSPLGYAAKHGHVGIVRLLLNRDLAIEPKDIDQIAALLHATARKHESVVELFLKHGEYIDSEIKKALDPSWSGWMWPGYKEPVTLLLEALVQKELPENIKSNIVGYAVEGGHHDIVQRLYEPDQWNTYVLEQLQSSVHNDLSTAIVSLLQLDSTISPSEDVYRWAVNNQHLDVILLLLARESQESFGEVAWEDILLAAIRDGKLDLTQTLLNSRPQLGNWRDELNRTVLFYACDSDKEDIVKALLDEHKADVNAQCKLGRTPLISAAYNEMDDVVAILLSHEGIEVDKTDKLGRDVLSIASQTGKVSLVKRLLKCSQVDPDSADSLRRTPLSWAAGEGHWGIVDCLISTHLVDIDYADTDGRTPLFWACSQGHEEAALRLLFAGCDPKLRDKGGQTALHVAAQAGSDSICNLLLEEVDPDVFDRNHNTALMLALENDHHKVVRLLQKTADVTLCFLAKQGRHRELQLLLEKGFNINAVDRQGRSLITLSVIYQARSVLQLLIQNNADMTLEDVDGLVPLQHAVQIRDCDAIRELLQAGSDTGMISAIQWYSAFSTNGNHMKMIEELDGKKSISFDPPNQHTPRPEPFQSHSGRSLLVVPELCSCSAVPAHLKTCKPTGLLFSNLGHVQEHKTYRIDAWYSPVMETEYLSRNKWAYFIEWTLQKSSTSSFSTWSTVEHRTTLPLGSIPESGLDFFDRLLEQITLDWRNTCTQANKRLTKLRQRVFRARGTDLGLIVDLLTSAHGLSYLRESLNEQIESAQSFHRQYCTLFHTDRLGECAGIIRNLAQAIGQQLDSLDQLSQSIIQIEFNLVSIREARESTSMSASMKRLSWITFIFLPAMFVSSIFGMNVDILANNPDWRWYILFVSICLLITFLGWLIFKYCNAEQWIYRKFGRPVEKCTERFREHQLYSHDYPQSSQAMYMTGFDIHASPRVPYSRSVGHMTPKSVRDYATI